MAGLSKEQNGLYRRVKTSNNYKGEEYLLKGYEFYGRGFADSPVVIEVGTPRSYYAPDLEFLGEDDGNE